MDENGTADIAYIRKPFSRNEWCIITTVQWNLTVLYVTDRKLAYMTGKQIKYCSLKICTKS